MSAVRKRLRDDIRLDILYEDRTLYGSALSGRAEAFLKRVCSGIADYRKRNGTAATVAHSRELLDELFSRELAPLYRTRDALSDDCLFPADDRVWPAALSVGSVEGVRDTIPLSRGNIGELASWLFEIQCGTTPPASSEARGLFERLEKCGALTEDQLIGQSSPEADIIFIGHATVMMTRGARVIIDPFILPRSSHYPESYQPDRVSDLLPLDAVFITHSHPDHFDLSTLIRLDPNTVIYVPEVERESLLAVDMASRLEQLGFSNVHRLRPGAEITFGGTKVRAFPFFGEQPTTGDILHPDVRNVGCTYLCESGGRRVLILADSGRDRDGDVRDVSAAIRRHFGDVDVVFGGYRAFAMYPILYLFSSVARFLLFVPPADLIFRQKIMNDSDDLLDTAERCGAKYVVPYATGGAPWYWERGLGWRPENVTGPRTDRTPEDVVRCASARATSADGLVPSPARVLVLHAGETLRFGEKDIQVEHGPTQIWPYDPPAWYQANIALRRDGGSMLASARSVFRAIGPNLNKWRKERELVCFFFMRKPPGLRLRFLAGSSIKNDVSALLDNLVHQSVIERWVTTVYEPETDRFGGTAAMQAIHEWFDADTRQWMILDRLRSEGRASIGRDDLCAAIALDFVKATVPDRAETWAIWRLYASSNGLEPSGMTETPFGDFTVIKSAASPEEQEVVQAYEEANRALSAQLICLWERGELSAGIRGVLAAIILFHFNRHGLDILSNSRIAWTMIRALDPSTEQVQRQRKS